MSEHQPAVIEETDIRIPEGHSWNKLPLILGIIGLVGLAASIGLRMGGPEDAKHFAFSYLVAFLFFISIPLGGLFFVLFNFASRAGWSVVVRRLSENFMATLVLFVLLLIPVFLGFSELYHHWLHPKPDDFVLQGKLGWLNSKFFIGRSIFYVVIWALMALWFYTRSVKQDSTGDQKISWNLQALSYPGIAIFAITVSFAAFDWMMSIDPHWYSTIYGVYYFAGCLVSIFAAMILVTVLAQKAGLLKKAINLEHFHDLGKFLFAFTVFWAYIAFSQYMLQWYGNIPEETLFYAKRWFVIDEATHTYGTAKSGWANVTLFLAIGHFVVPFFFLMPRTIKRKPVVLAFGAGWMLLMHLVDTYWLIMPNAFHGPHLGLVDLTTLLGVGGIFLAGFFWFARRQALVPIKDPRLSESLRFENF